MRRDNPNGLHVHHFGCIDAGSYALGGDEQDATCVWCGGLVYKPEWGVRSDDDWHITDYARLRVWSPEGDIVVYLCDTCLKAEGVITAMQDEIVALLAGIPTGSSMARARRLALMVRGLLPRQRPAEGRGEPPAPPRQWEKRLRRRVAAYRSPPERPKYVYLMRSKSTGLIKIGQSVEPKARRSQIQCEVGDKLEILKVIPDEEGGLESKLHHRFADLRTKHPGSERGREWFMPGDDLLDFAGGE